MKPSSNGLHVAGVHEGRWLGYTLVEFEQKRPELPAPIYQDAKDKYNSVLPKEPCYI